MLGSANASLSYCFAFAEFGMCITMRVSLSPINLNIIIVFLGDVKIFILIFILVSFIILSYVKGYADSEKAM